MIISIETLEKYELSNYHHTNSRCQGADHSRCHKLDLLKKENLQTILTDIDKCFTENTKFCDSRPERIEFLLGVLFRLTELPYSCAAERTRVIIEKKLYNIAEGYKEEVVKVLDTTEYEKYERLKNVTAKLRYLAKCTWWNRGWSYKKIRNSGYYHPFVSLVDTRFSHHLRKRFGNVLVSNKVTTYVGGFLIVLAGVGLIKPKNVDDEVSSDTIVLGWVTIIYGSLIGFIPFFSAWNAAREKNP